MDPKILNVIDPRLAAGRGEEFSASRRREKEEELGLEEDFRMPISQRVEDSLDTEGLQMASKHTAIPDSNKGFQMLQRMGWKGRGLGSNENGIVEPVGEGAEAGVRLGLGKQEEDSFYTASDNVQRKRLEVEIQATEDESRTAARELQSEREQRIKEDVSTIKRTFYCEVCHKQYSSASEMEVHLSSYDHHHKKRLIEMRNDENERTRGERSKREKKRQEKELLRLNEQIQRARGTATPAAQPPLPEGTPPLPPDDANTLPPPLANFPSSGGAQAVPPPPQGGIGAPSLQFNMGSTPGIKKPLQKSVGFGLQKPGAKKVGKLKSSVAAFAMDSDDEM